MMLGQPLGEEMQTKAKTKSTLAIIALATLTVAGGTSAYASEEPAPKQDSSDIVYTPVKPTTDRVMINGELTDIAVMPGFDMKAPAVVLDDKSRPISADVSIVSADGQVSELSVVSSDDRSALASCWRGWVAPGTGLWYTSVPGCSLIGTANNTKAYYNWTVDFNSQGAGCLQGRGYKARHLPGGGYTFDEYWTGLGCGTGGDFGGGEVNWGVVASTKVVQMMSYSVPTGASGMFR